MNEAQLSVRELDQLQDKDDYEVWDHVTNEWVPIQGCRYLERGRGFSDISEAFNPVTAVSVYCDWLATNFTLVLKPKTYTQDQAQEICDKFDNTVLCSDEEELLDVFLTLIEDADVLTGWNSEGYDIPYLGNRIVQVLGREHTRRLCLWNKLPKKREYESYGKPTFTYDLSGRVHLDYLQLYRKHTLS